MHLNNIIYIYKTTKKNGVKLCQIYKISASLSSSQIFWACDCMIAAIRNSVVAVVGVFAVASCSPFVAADLV